MLRDADGDDGKLGAAQRMELEEAAALEKWVENVPMMTIEGQPLSENVKREKERAHPRPSTSISRRRHPHPYSLGQPHP